MYLLILGYSSIVRRRVLPAALSVGNITGIGIATRRGRVPEPAGDITWFSDYGEALGSSGADAVYVSGVNAAHAEWVHRSLEQGLHVIVDKPAFLDVASAEDAVALARRQRKVLAEATVFPFHPQFATFRSLVEA